MKENKARHKAESLGTADVSQVSAADTAGMEVYMRTESIEGVLGCFQLEGTVSGYRSYGSGHINSTFLVNCDTEKGRRRYILQCMNRDIFQNIDGLMSNIASVTEFLRKKIIANHGDPERETLTLVKSVDGKSYVKDAEGNSWRVYLFVEDTISFDVVEKPEDFYESAYSFGHFQRLLSDYPADTLVETIPDFHNTPARFEQLQEAVNKNEAGRLEEVKAELDFVMARKEELRMAMDMLKEGKLPLRVTHNDTKLNNILMDKDTRKGICIIDLDTVMPGLSIHDFGDSIRFGANTAEEDEPDTSKVSLSLPLFEAYVKGFLEGCEGSLTKTEVDMLPMGAKLMTIECGMRFLADYLNGDVYFKIHREKQNLDRARTQFALVADMERKWEQMRVIVDKYR